MFATIRKSDMTILRLWLIVVLAGCCSAVSADEVDAQRAFHLVQQGIQSFEAADFDAAVANFEEAISLTTDTSVIRFDQACVELAKGETDSAREKLRDVVSGSDPDVVQSAHYNLGILKVQQAKASIPSDPTQVPKKDRKEVVDQLEQAARSFRNTLEINPDHADAAYNLELVRMYVKHLQTIWKQQDEQEQEPEESLRQLILRLQSSFRDSTQRISQLRDEQKSASRQTALADFQQDLESLNSDVQNIRPLVEQWLQSVMSAGKTQDPGQPAPQPTPEELAAQKSVTAIVDQIESASQETLSSTVQEDWSTARQSSIGAVLHLHQLFLNVASYQEALQAALQKQMKLNSAIGTSASNGEATKEQTELWGLEQQLISDLVQAFQIRAEQQKPEVDDQLAKMEETSQDSTRPGNVPPPVTSPATGTPPESSGAPSSLEVEQQKAMLEGLSESMERAISLGPDAVTYANKASDLILETGADVDAEKTKPGVEPDLTAREWAQRKVRLILQDIAEPLVDPESDQQQPNDQGQQNDPNQPSDEQSSDNESSDSNDPDDSDSNDDGDDEAQSPEQQQPNDANDSPNHGTDPRDGDQEDNPPVPLKDMAERQAEAVLRKAAEREQEYRELLKQLQQRLRRKQATKDW